MLITIDLDEYFGRKPKKPIFPRRIVSDDPTPTVELPVYIPPKKETFDEMIERLKEEYTALSDRMSVAMSKFYEPVSTDDVSDASFNEFDAKKNVELADKLRTWIGSQYDDGIYATIARNIDDFYRDTYALVPRIEPVMPGKHAR